MKKIILSLSVVLGSALLTSCGGTGASALLGAAGQTLVGGGQTANGVTTQATTSAFSGVLGSLLGDLLGTNTVSQTNIQGTWNYVGPDCVFESENFLAKAGGEVVAQKVESQISAMFMSGLCLKCRKETVKQESCPRLARVEGSILITS